MPITPSITSFCICTHRKNKSVLNAPYQDVAEDAVMVKAIEAVAVVDAADAVAVVTDTEMTATKADGLTRDLGVPLVTTFKIVLLSALATLMTLVRLDMAVEDVGLLEPARSSKHLLVEDVDAPPLEVAAAVTAVDVMPTFMQPVPLFHSTMVPCSTSMKNQLNPSPSKPPVLLQPLIRNKKRLIGCTTCTALSTKRLLVTTMKDMAITDINKGGFFLGKGEQRTKILTVMLKKYTIAMK